MDSNDFVSALARDGAALADAAEAAGLGTAVEACPKWSVGDVVWHLVFVHDLFHRIVSTRALEPQRFERPEPPSAADLLPIYRAGLAALVESLRDVDPATEVWTFTNDHSVGFIARRMAHETAVHRWDIEQAAGREFAIDAELASDGIDEFLTHFAGIARDPVEPVNGSVHIHCADVPGEWTLDPAVDGPGFDIVREHRKGDCALRGPASDLLLALWRRLPLSEIDVVGDGDVAARFVAYPRLR